MIPQYRGRGRGVPAPNSNQLVHPAKNENRMTGYQQSPKEVPGPMSRYEELLKDFEAYSRSAGGEKSLMQHIAERLHAGTTRYNWVGFYLMEAPAFDTL